MSAQTNRRPAPRCRHKWVTGADRDGRPVVACEKCRKVKRIKRGIETRKYR